MSEAWLEALRQEFAGLQARLDAGAVGVERQAVKRDIVAYFKRVDGSLGELAALKEQIRGLVDQYKKLAGDVEGEAAPQFGGARPVLQADHLGASTYIEKGWSLISLGDHAGAVQALEKALALAPDEIQALSLLGWAQMLSNSYDEALGTFSKVLMREPANALARVNVGYICLKKQIFGEAIEHLSRAIRLDNDRKATLYAHFYLGLVYQERQMYEDAEAFFQKALALGPNLVEAYYELGRSRWFDGRREAAAQAWTEGEKANKFNPWGKRCRELLDIAAAGGDIPRQSPA